VELSLLSFNWWIALCACLETPGGILELVASDTTVTH